ncbi:MAG: hypothetical protein ACRCXD_03865 [Luteolibacter sp.]
MKTIFYILLSFQCLSMSGLAQHKSFEVPVYIVRMGQRNLPVENIEILPLPFGSSSVMGAIPGRTDGKGKALIRFQSRESIANLNYEVTEGPDGKKWFVRFHGLYPDGGADLPPHRTVASPDKNSELKMEAYPSNEAAIAARFDLVQGRTAMIGAAIAKSVTLPPLSESLRLDAKPYELKDPIQSFNEVAKILETSPEIAKQLVKEWQAAVVKAPENSKLDEKALSALVDGDTVKAAKFAVKAEELTGLEKQNLGAISDTGRLVETVYHFNKAAQDIGDSSTDSEAIRRLRKSEGEIGPLRPSPAAGRIPEGSLDKSKLKNFSKEARETSSKQ